jgi:hypothetical protein
MTWVCSICDVPLWKKPRYNGQSCFHLFLQSEALFDPSCCAETQGIQVSKRSQDNRQTLPSHCMAAASVGGAGHDDDDSAGGTEGATAARNLSRGNNNDEKSPERVATRRRTCSNVTVPVRRSRRSRLS